MKSTESKLNVCYFEVNAMFNGEPLELLEKEYVDCRIENWQRHGQGGPVISGVRRCFSE